MGGSIGVWQSRFFLERTYCIFYDWHMRWVGGGVGGEWGGRRYVLDFIHSMFLHVDGP